MAYFSVATEGILDSAVARRLLEDAGHTVYAAYTQSGKSQLDPKIPGFNNAARFAPWLVFRDFDHDAACPPELAESLCPEPSEQMVLRLPVRAIESWLLADQVNFSRFAGVAQRLLPDRPDDLDYPKNTLLDIVRQSRYSGIRADIVPARGSGRSIAPGYNGRLTDFVFNRWNPVYAATRSESLRRCLSAIERIAV